MPISQRRSLNRIQEPMTKGVACRTENCAPRMHMHCYNAWVRARRDRPLECPQCKKSWKEDAVRKVGEEAIKGDQVHRRVARGGEDEEEPEGEEVEVEMEAEEEEEENVMEVDEPTGKTKKKGQR
jgi:glutaredoxin